jgi:hypothetical protein
MTSESLDPADEPVPPDRPDSSGPGERSSGCVEAARLLPLFLRGGIDREEERRYREHILACADCREIYRESVASAAPLGHSRRLDRVEEVRLRRQAQMRTRAFAVGGHKSGRRFGLRVILPLVMLFLLMTMLNPLLNRPQLKLEWVRGEVRVPGKLLHALEPEIDINKGDWCLTEVDASARIETAKGEFRLGARTNLMIEDPAERRVRLQRGRLEIDGSALVVCQFGIAELEEGRATIVLTDGRLEILCHEGTLHWIHAGGTQILSAGERANSQLPGPLLSLR